jgi:hypothetical protein
VEASMIIDMREWIEYHKTLLFWLGVGSTLTFLIALFGMPFLIVRIPTDYFSPHRRHHSLHRRHHDILSNLPPVLHGLIWIGKNILGIIFVLVGMTMLVLPGQGILTIVAGILLLSFPGKFHLARWIVKRSPVRKTMNWFRRRAGKAPLILD